MIRQLDPGCSMAGSQCSYAGSRDAQGFWLRAEGTGPRNEPQVRLELQTPKPQTLNEPGIAKAQ